MNVQISFCNQTTFTKCTTQKVLESLIFTSTFLPNLPHVFEAKSAKLTNKQIASDCQTYKANDIKLFNLSRVFSFFSWTIHHAVIWLIISLVFVFGIMVLNEPRKFTFHSSSRKKTQFYRSL